MTKNTTRRRQAAFTARTFDSPAIRAARLDRMADAELMHGHFHAAEHLSRQAAELREARQ